MYGKKWTPWEIDVVLKSRRPREIAEITGRTYSSVTQFMYHNGIKAKMPKGRERLTREEREKIVERYMNTDCSYQTIAKDYNVSRDTIRKVIIKYYERGFVL